MGKPAALNEQTLAVLQRNGIDLEHKSVVFQSEDTVHLLDHVTRDEIIIYQGDKKWSSY